MVQDGFGNGVIPNAFHIVQILGTTANSMTKSLKSASRPMNNDDLRELKEKRNTPEGKLDKNGNPLKFSRDLESDWSVPCVTGNVLCLCSEKS